jgi:hypothetical protein
MMMSFESNSSTNSTNNRGAKNSPYTGTQISDDLAVAVDDLAVAVDDLAVAEDLDRRGGGGRSGGHCGGLLAESRLVVLDALGERALQRRLGEERRQLGCLSRELQLERGEQVPGLEHLVT